LIVVDASMLTDYLVGREAALDALGPRLDGDGYEPLHAPELIEPETLNALRRMALSGAITDQRAGQAAVHLGTARLARYSHAPLRARVWELRHTLTAYDASYLALAEALDGSTLMTGDGGLAAAARSSLGDERVRHVV